jgi:hypothetical protein
MHVKRYCAAFFLQISASALRERHGAGLDNFDHRRY